LNGMLRVGKLSANDSAIIYTFPKLSKRHTIL